MARVCTAHTLQSWSSSMQCHPNVHFNTLPLVDWPQQPLQNKLTLLSKFLKEPLTNWLTIIGPMLLNSSAHVDDVLDVVDGNVIDDVSNVLAYFGIIDSWLQHGLAWNQIHWVEISIETWLHFPLKPLHVYQSSPSSIRLSQPPCFVWYHVSRPFLYRFCFNTCLELTIH